MEQLGTKDERAAWARQQVRARAVCPRCGWLLVGRLGAQREAAGKPYRGHVVDGVLCRAVVATAGMVEPQRRWAIADRVASERARARGAAPGECPSCWQPWSDAAVGGQCDVCAYIVPADMVRP